MGKNHNMRNEKESVEVMRTVPLFLPPQWRLLVQVLVPLGLGTKKMRISADKANRMLTYISAKRQAFYPDGGNKAILSS